MPIPGDYEIGQLPPPSGPPGGASMLGPALGAATGLVGSILGAAGQSSANQANAEAQAAANQQNFLNQKDNQQWMEMMSNSAYQRQMEDMKKAGLNPMLAMMKGGASTPSSSQAQAQAPKAENIHANTTSSASALSSLMVNQDIQNRQLAIQANQAAADIQLKAAQVLTEGYSASAEEARGENIKAETSFTKSRQAITDLDLPRAQAEAKFESEFGGMRRKASLFQGMLSGILGSVQDIKDLASPIPKLRLQLQQDQFNYKKQMGEAVASPRFKRK